MSNAERSPPSTRRKVNEPPHDKLLEGDLRHKMYVVIFGTETPQGRAFDLALLIVIVFSIVAVMLESVAGIASAWGRGLRIAEWAFTILFTIEYIVRLYCVPNRLRYAVSFFGVVDLLSVLPTYLSVMFGGLQTLLVIRVLRLLRVFRVLKVVRMLGEATTLMHALRASLPKIGVFVGVVMTVVVIVGAVMHLVEGADSGFTSIPKSMYWAVVTLTTVGYGDIAPQTPLGQTLAATLMILGYGIIAVPTGIVSAELVQASKCEPGVRCRACGAWGHTGDAHYCRVCGVELV